MKTVTAFCATLMAAALFSGGSALADDRCAPADAAAGLCAPLHFVDGTYSRTELLRRRAYERGYRDALNRGREVAPPPSVALDGKEGYSQSYSVHRQYLDRDDEDGRRASRRDYDRDDYDRGYDRRWEDRGYERRARRDDDRGDYDRRYDRRWEDRGYERRARRDSRRDRDEVVNFADQLLRGLSN